MLAAGDLDSSDVDPLTAPSVYQLRGCYKKRGREAGDGSGGASEGDQAEGAADADEAADADAAWEAAENAYHVDLVDILRQPRMYRALGLSGPPRCIRHPSLKEKLGHMRLLL